MIKFEKTIKDNYIMNFIGGIGNSICLCFFRFSSFTWGCSKHFMGIGKSHGCHPIKKIWDFTSSGVFAKAEVVVGDWNHGILPSGYD